MRVLFATALVACSHVNEASETECAGAISVEDVQHGAGERMETQRTCRWANRSLVVTTDRVGKVVYRHEMKNGFFDGFQLSNDQGVRSEQHYRNGELDGFNRRYRDDEVIAECFLIDGVRDGVCWDEWGGVRQYDRGQRTGIWRVGSHVWIYGGDVLLARDGAALPLPRETIDVDGISVVRRSCDARESGDACKTLFEDYQRCEMVDAADLADCRAKARDTYREESRRLGRKGLAR